MSIRPAFPTPFSKREASHPKLRTCLGAASSHLVGRPAIDYGLLRRHLTLHPHHRQLIESYLSPTCRNVAASKLGTLQEALTIWGENIVVQWADKDYQGQLDSFFLDEAIAKLIKDPFMSWSDAWDYTICLTTCPPSH